MLASKLESAPVTSLQLEAVLSGPQIWASWSTDRQSFGFAGLTTTVSASFAIWMPSYGTSFFLQIAASSGSISREASLIAVSPTQNFSNPPPVPAWPTLTSTSEFDSLNFSATAWVSGPTVLEPSTRIEPDRAPALDPPLAVAPSSLEPPHAATPMAIAPQQEKASIDLRVITWFGLLRLICRRRASQRGPGLLLPGRGGLVKKW